MRNVILTAIVLFLAAIGAGYCILWYSQANAMRNSVLYLIDQINTNEKIITYDSVEASGFPKQIVISIVNPHFKGRARALVRSLNGETAETVLPNLPKPPQPWVEEIALDGRIIMSVNNTADLYSFLIQGNWQNTSTIDGHNYTMRFKQNGDTSCTLQMQQGAGATGTLWNYRPALQGDEDLLKRLHVLDCRNNGLSIIDPFTQEILASLGSFHSSISADDAPKGTAIQFYYKTADLLVTTKGDEAFTRYAHELSPNFSYSTNFSAKGNQNTEIDMEFTGPTLMKDLMESPEIQIDLRTLDITNSLYTHHYKGTVKTSAQSLKGTITGKSRFTEACDKQLPTQMHSYVENLYNSQNPAFAPVVKAMHQYTVPQIDSIIYPAMFTLSPLGEITSTIDFVFESAPPYKYGIMKFNNFQVSAAPYGIKATGTVGINDRLPHTASLTVVCSNCPNIVDDIVAYSKRAQAATQYFSPALTATLADIAANKNAANNTLITLANPEDSTANGSSMSFNLTVDRNGKWSINGKNAAEILTMLTGKHPASQ